MCTNDDWHIITELKISKALLVPGTKRFAEFFDVGCSEQEGMWLNAAMYQQLDGSLKIDIRSFEDETEISAFLWILE